MSATLTTYASREEWLNARLSGVGASEVAAVLGCDPYKSAFAVWAEKTRQVEAPLVGSAAFFGNKLEPVVAEVYAEQTGFTLVDDGRTAIWRGEHPSLFASLDRRIQAPRGQGVLEIKAPGFKQTDAWENGPPLKFQIQVQAQLAVTGIEWAVIAALIGGQDFRTYEIARNEELIEVIEDSVASFWTCVREKQMPEVDGSEATADALKRLYPSDSGREVELSSDAEVYVADLERAKSELKKWNEAESLAKNKLIALIGDATSARIGRATYTYRTQRREAHTVAAAEFRVLRKAGR